MSALRWSTIIGLIGLSVPSSATAKTSSPLDASVNAAEASLHQTFTNLHFQDFGPAPVRGPIYQAKAGGHILYYAPQSGHLLFAAVYDQTGVNVTALAESEAVAKGVASIDPSKALAIGPANAPTVIEFTDPECPFCRALERYWATKAAEGRPVRRLIYFVSGIHPRAAAIAEHILCSPDREAAFHTAYAGAAPSDLKACAPGKAKVASDAALVSKIGVAGTPTLVLSGKLVSGFQQGDIETWLTSQGTKRPVRADHGGG